MLDVVGRQGDSPVVRILHLHGTVFGDGGDGPQVTVLDEALALAGGESAVIAAGDDAVTDACLIAVSELDGAGEADVPGVHASVLGHLVEERDVAVGGRHHERGAALGFVMLPGVDDASEHVGACAAVDAAGGEVPVDVAVFTQS